MEPIYRIIFSSIFFFISFASLAQCPGGQVEVTVAVETDLGIVLTTGRVT